MLFTHLLMVAQSGVEKSLEKWPQSDAGKCDSRICEEYRLVRRLKWLGE